MTRHGALAGRLRHLRGWKKDYQDHRDRVFSAPPVLANAAVLPPSVSLRGTCPPVRDQGSIGSCVANAVLEAAGFLYTTKSLVDPKLSRLFTYFYTRQMEGTPATEDSGSQIRTAVKCLARLGSPLEATWPYDESRFAEEPPEVARAQALDHQAVCYYRCPTLYTLKASLVQGFPVVFGFSIPESIYSAATSATGVVQYPAGTGGFAGGHAVLAVGYDDSKEQVQFMNSWSPFWGDGGFGYLPYRFFKESLADDLWTLRSVEQPQ